jgi:heme/copper-type cytochrome/quinol oxidase subunit 3
MRQKDKIFFTIFVGLALAMFLISTSYAMTEKEVDRVEYGDNVRTTYYKDGSKLVEVQGFINATVALSATTTSVTTTSTAIYKPSIDIVQIPQFIYYVVGTVVLILGFLGRQIYVSRKKNPRYVQKYDQ